MSGPTVADGRAARWRGAPVTLAGTWADSVEASVTLPQLQPGGEYGSWTGDLDIAVGALGPGESWDAAARGDYDDRWRSSLTALAAARRDLPAVTHVRFAHESNGNWYDWRVTRGDVAGFQASWARYRAMQIDLFPAARLVFNVNRESVDSGVDWRETFPGSDYVDLLSVDYYNQYPFVTTVDDWERSLAEEDRFGAPKGLDRHLEFARDNGLSLAVSEWSSNASMGDSPVFVEKLHEWFSGHGPDGDDGLAYEILFNVEHSQENLWQFFPDTRQPFAAAAYRRLW